MVDSYKSITGFTIVRQMAPLSSGLSAAENDIIAAVYLIVTTADTFFLLL